MKKILAALAFLAAATLHGQQNQVYPWSNAITLWSGGNPTVSAVTAGSNDQRGQITVTSALVSVPRPRCCSFGGEVR